MKFGIDWPSGFREEDVLKIMVMYMYIASGQGQTTPWVIFDLQYYSVNIVLCCKFFSI